MFLTDENRAEYRAALKQFTSYQDKVTLALAGGTPLTPVTRSILNNMTGTQELSGQAAALEFTYNSLNKQYDEALMYAGRDHYSPFCEYMFRHEVPALHHEFIIKHMEMIHHKEILRLGITLPPGAAKTTYASLRFAAWHLGRKPDDRYLQGGHTQTFAKDMLGKPVRDLINEPRYRDVFPEMVLSASSAAADYFKFAGHKGFYKAFGVGTACAGYRAEIIGVDDPFGSREDAESKTTRGRLHTWFDDDFGTRGSGTTVPIFIVNTRWHEDDLVGHELEKMADNRAEHPWTIINIPALAEEDDPLGRAEGVGLWPEIFGTTYYEGKKRSLTGRSWNSLYQGHPTDEAGGVLSDEDVTRYQSVPVDEFDSNGDLMTKVIKHITLSVDCAEKANERADYTAATVWVETMDKKHYMIHAARTKKEFIEMVEWIESLAREYSVDEIIVEDRGAGTQYIQLRQHGGAPAPVTAIATKQQSKEFRFDGVTPQFKIGTALLPERSSWIADVERELFAFPNGRYDDYVDTTSQYLAKVRDGQWSGGATRMRAGLSKT